MDINFPLVLVCVVALMGVVILIDKYYLREHRPDGVEEPWLVDFSRSLFAVFVFVLVVRSFIVEPFKIPSSSMVPTLLIGDFILVNKYHYGLRLPVTNTKVYEMNEPERGDVMVFFPPHDSRYFIKRVIGMPGDEISYINNVLYVNGKKVPQKLISGEPENNPANFYYEETLENGASFIARKRKYPSSLSRNYSGYKVPEGHYFMMGDNRDRSSDSRVWGAVPEENIVGKAFFVWMHWDKFWSLPKFDTIRRIGVE